MMLSIRSSSSSDSPSLHPLQSGQLSHHHHLPPLHRSQSGRSASKTPPMPIHPTEHPPPRTIFQCNLNQPLFMHYLPKPAHHRSIISQPHPSSSIPKPPPPSCLSTHSSSLTVLLFDRLSADHRATKPHFNSPNSINLASRSLLLYLQKFIMIPQPTQDQLLLRSFLADIAKSCYWSSLIRPLIFLVISYQPTLRPSDRPLPKLLNPPKLPESSSPPAKLPLRLAAPPAPKRFRAARGFKCSPLVDPDPSILHQHQPASFHLARSTASRTIPQSALFIPPSRKVISQLEIHRLSARAQSRMQRSPYCPAEDSLDGDQRHQRYYLVNAYREKLLLLYEPSDTPLHPPVRQQFELGSDDDEDEHEHGCNDDDDGLEPLEDLLDWDSSTRQN
ncbi:hypothetical protein PGT21_000515 [Puccinia graminis f. sp. tritici]|uniref:Uncharacterized protein n=2 Tax=Puccinia graminis f. sp. tritici TaxID=56615 RepID=A0A5B0Q1I8_PUCGR|nr:hypothetical protein PGT21_000515 [Puccinia graminis f. sp. tritici]KAA1127936.1 hypothetical protein PGTUg99_014563 [Puccinia graminis f. sp. tritici]